MKPLSFYLPEDLRALLAGAHERQRIAQPGARWTRSDVLRRALVLGLERLDQRPPAKAVRR